MKLTYIMILNVLSLLSLVVQPVLAQTCNLDPNLAFISEFHYKNTGNDEGQFIEIAHCDNIGGYRIELGTLISDRIYQTFTPAPTWTSEAPDENGFFYSVFVYNEIRDGPGYIRLVGNMVDALTYEDTSNLNDQYPDVLVFESESTPISHSLQRVNGVWVGPLPQPRPAAVAFTPKCGTSNQDQAFISEFHYKNTGNDEGQFIEIAHCDNIGGYRIELGTLISDRIYQTFTPAPTWTSEAPDENGFFYSVFVYSEIRDGPGYIQLYGPKNYVIDGLTYEDTSNLNDEYPDVIVFESESTPIGHSLQRVNGAWVGPLPQPRPAAVAFTQKCGECEGDQAFISEFHYKNTGNDEGQFIEIAHCYSIDSYSIELGTLISGIYQTFTPAPTWTSEAPDENGFLYSVFVYSEIRDGPGYIKLFRDFYFVVDALTYEDTSNMDNEYPDVFVFESESTPIGHSLQRVNGEWVGPLPQPRPIAVAFTQKCSTSNRNLAFISEFHYKNTTNDEGQFVEIAHCSSIENYKIELATLPFSLYQAFTPTPILTITTPDTDGFLYSVFMYSDIRDGPGQITLSDGFSNVVDAVTYEDTSNQENTYPDVVVFESETTSIGHSLQRVRGAWIGPLPHTKGMRPAPVPTKAPTGASTKAPTRAPTKAPTRAPTKAPSRAPTKAPTRAPTKAPTRAPTKAPTRAPTKASTRFPTKAPTRAPTKAPTRAPTKAPSRAPTKAPTKAPTRAPGGIPITVPVPTVATLPVITTPNMIPVKPPTKCGLFGLSFFCPLPGKCGFFRRLFRLGGC